MSRRQVQGSRKAATQTALERLRQQRAGDRSALRAGSDDERDDDEDVAVFDEMDEADYQLLMRKRLQEDDFVVDDDGLGYVDYGDGGDDVGASGSSRRRRGGDDDDGSSASSSEEEEGAKKKKKRKRTDNGQQNIGAMLLKQQQLQTGKSSKRVAVVGPAAALAGASSGGKAVAGAKDSDDALQAMLNEIDNEAERIEQSTGVSAPATATSRFAKKKKTAAGLAHMALFGSSAQLMEKAEAVNPFAKPLPEVSTIADDNEDVDDATNPFEDDGNDLRNDAGTQETPLTNETSPASKGPSSEDVDAPAPAALKVLQPKFKSTGAGAKQPVRDVKRPVAPAKPPQGSVSATLEKQSIAGGWLETKQNTTHMDSPAATAEKSTTATSFGTVSNGDLRAAVFEEDGSLLMYWLDAFEARDGTVYLFGKVWNRTAQTFVSCCLSVGGSERTMHFLPRPKQLDASGTPTDTDVSMESLWEEIDNIMSRNKISQWGLREKSMKYAFEVPDIPIEADWVEVTYPFTYPTLPSTLSGSTFSNVFGTNASALELLLLKANLMGPSWVVIRGAKISSMNISWCKVEATVDLCTKDADRIANGDQCNVQVLTDVELDTGKYPDHCRSSPPLVVLSYSMKTVMNYKMNVNEIVALSAIIFHQAHQTNVSYCTAVRPLNQNVYPMGFLETVRQQELKIEDTQTERGLLNFFLAHLHRVDPDIIVGHNFLGYDLDVLLHRMRDLRVSFWSRLGRLRRSQFPKLQAGAGGMGDSTYAERSITSGRLICDSYLSAKNVLKVERPALDIDRIPQYFNDKTDLIWLTQHCENDAYLAMRLVLQLMSIPLTKQLTNLAGNLWSRTMTGGRAERNEYLLLHEFHKAGYIVPDKASFGELASKDAAKAGKKDKKNIKEAAKKSATSNDNHGVQEARGDDDDDEEDAQEVKRTGRRKPAYLGGLVLEPKKGLYDKFVLMLDFNSLYPSIIREYNICFTTVERKLVIDGDGGEEEIPDVPDSGLEQGILPKLLATFVERRRQVKGLMKNADPKSAEYAQLNIRQQALKLTANSMYGCLGFTMSRFYAKPLAMLITSKGRQILQETVNLAEQTLSLDVIYGDTDSIMIYTNTDDLAEVKSMGQKLKVAVNKKYRLLEIEMDGFFRRMLLLKKKKYAALTAVEGDDGKLILSREFKGLDLVRRDWCGLSKEVSEFVLDQILSDNDREETLNNIHAYLQKVGEEARAGKVPIEKFVINKGLTKAPEEYNDAKAQPHVQVALALKAKGQSARVGDTVPYVICKDEDMTKSFAMRAHHPDDLKREENLTIDVDYYLNIQVHPPVARLCQPIEGTDAGRIAECLGLDSSKFKAVTSTDRNDDQSLGTFESQIADAERFKNAERLKFSCTGCGHQYQYDCVVRKEDGGDMVCGLVCDNCHQLPNENGLVAQLTLAMRRNISRYYEGWLMCDDASCHNRTRQMSVYGSHCIVGSCRGVMHHEYADSDLYTQFIYFDTLFDVDRYVKKLEKSKADEKDHVQSVTASYAPVYQLLRRAVKQYLDKCGRGYVDLGKLFSFALKKQPVGAQSMLAAR